MGNRPDRPDEQNRQGAPENITVARGKAEQRGDACPLPCPVRGGGVPSQQPGHKRIVRSGTVSTSLKSSIGMISNRSYQIASSRLTSEFIQNKPRESG